MATDAGLQVLSNLPVPPGAVLEEELEARDMTQRELAQRTGRPYQAINEIVRGRKALTHETALDLERVLGVPAHVWVNLESIYRMTLARDREREFLHGQAEWLEDFPVREMERRGWIPRHRDKAGTAQALLTFLGVASFPAWIESRHAVQGFRISGNARISPGALAVWLQKGELDGHDVETADYNESMFRRATGQIRSMTTILAEESRHGMTTLCAEAGVVVVFTPELPRIGTSSAARWLSPTKGLIQMGLRWRRADIFWFNFFRECCYILRHRVRDLHIDGIDGDPESEVDANEFAKDVLISPRDWARFNESGPTAPLDAIRFAEEISVDPSIVVGRMQREGLITDRQWGHLVKRLEWAA